MTRDVWGLGLRVRVGGVIVRGRSAWSASSDPSFWTRSSPRSKTETPDPKRSVWALLENAFWGLLEIASKCLGVC